jgi:arginine decarboxylase
MGLKELCEQVHQVYREDNLPKAQKDMYTALPEMVMRPADTYDLLVHEHVESVEIDELMDRTLAVMIVPYPPGIPVIMPGERITKETKSIYDYLLYARDFDRKFPGFETDIHGLRFEPMAGGRRYFVDCVREAKRRRSTRRSGSELAAPRSRR